MMETLPNFTPRVQQALSAAKELAAVSFTSTITLDHLFLGLLGLRTTLLHSFFTRHEILIGDLSLDLTESISKDLIKRQSDSPGPEEINKNCVFDPAVKSVLAIASLAAEKLKHEYVGVEHLLLGFLKHKASPLLAYLRAVNKDPTPLIYDLKSLFRDDLPLTSPFDNPEWRRSPTPPFNPKDPLEAYTVNFNQLAIDGKLDTVIGRDQELQDLAEILCRRKKNNPILLGSAGVGKTALAEGLAQQIVKGECADFLIPKIIYGLDLASLIAGTKYRGQFEERLQNLIALFKKNEHAIIFIDELHTLVGAGSAEGTLDAANILKPSLARGEVTCIGATTLKEYKKNIEKDAALARRFQPLIIEEPTTDETIQILSGIKHKYEEFHGVKYPPSLIKLIVELSGRYIPERYMPDKAIDILDQAASRRKLAAFKRPDEAKEIEKKLNMSLDLNKMGRNEESLFNKYKKILDTWAEKASLIIPRVREKDVIDVIVAKTGVSEDMLRRHGCARFRNLNKVLQKIIIGQDDAVQTTSNALLRGQIGLSDPAKPLGSFLFLGPSGVGKTYLAKVLSDHVFGGGENLIQINMSEYSDKINASRLIGAAPGYVGYDEAGQLTEQIRKRPHSLVLFDEVEKAHPEVTNLLLQILEEGKLTDSFGRDVSFTNALIVATGNIGANLFTKNHSLGFGPVKDGDGRREAILRKAEEILRPELINRFTESVIFNSLTRDNLTSIIKLEIKVLQKRLKDTHNLKLVVRQSFINSLVPSSAKEKEGARGIKSLIKQELENKLASLLSTENISKITEIVVTSVRGESKLKIST